MGLPFLLHTGVASLPAPASPRDPPASHSPSTGITCTATLDVFHEKAED